MRDVGGRFGFDDLRLDARPLPERLPRFVPQTDGTGIAELDAQLGWPAYAVGLRRIFSPSSHRIVPRFTGTTAHRALGLPADRLAVLVGYGEDPLVEAFWTRRHRDGLLEAIASQHWDLVLAPNYSIYGNWPRVEHLLNMRRSLLVASELAERGVPVVPNLYWYRLEDLTRWNTWIRQQTNMPGIAVNLQTVRQPADWDSWALPGLTWLSVHLPPDLPVVLTGLSRADRISLMVELFGDRLIVVSQNPHQYALHGAVMTPDGRRDVHAHKADAFAATVHYMAHLLEPHWNSDGGIDQ